VALIVLCSKNWVVVKIEAKSLIIVGATAMYPKPVVPALKVPRFRAVIFWLGRLGNIGIQAPLESGSKGLAIATKYLRAHSVMEKPEWFGRTTRFVDRTARLTTRLGFCLFLFCFVLLEGAIENTTCDAR